MIYKYLALIIISTSLSACSYFKGKVEEPTVKEVYKDRKTGNKLELSEENTVSKPKINNEMRIALLVPLSGPNSALGKNILNATQLAIHDTEATHLHFKPIDTALGTDVVLKYLEAESPDLVIGPIYASEAQQIYNYTEKKNICMITFSNDADLRDKNCVFMLGFMPYQSIERALEYANRNGIKTVTALLPENKYGDIIANRISDSKTKIYRYGNDEASMLHDIAMIRSEQYGLSTDKYALLIPETGKALKAAVNSFKNAPNTQLIGSGLWEDEKLYSLTDLQNTIFAASPKSDKELFEKKFEKQYGYKPLRIAALGYDAVALVTSLANTESGKNGVNDSTLTNPQGFKGITGIFRFNRDGTNQRGLAVYKITGGNLLEIESAPEAFSSPTQAEATSPNFNSITDSIKSLWN